jgi:hypothetical protein
MDPERIYTVNEVIDSLSEMNGKTVRIRGVLSLEFEGDCILHLANIERRSDYQSSLYAYFGRVGLDYLGRSEMGIGRDQCQAFDKRHVVVTATILEENRGHLSLWPGSVLILAISKWKVDK